MGAARSRATPTFLLILVFLNWGCGSGGDSTVSPPPPGPQGSFSLTLGSTEVGVIAGDQTRVNVSIQPSNGFSGNVTLSTQGLPSGVSASFATNPLSPGLTAELVLQALPSAAPVTASLTVRGVSGSLSDSKTVPLRVAARPPNATFRSAYVDVDGPLFNIAFDPASHLVFAANPQLNVVEVFSSLTRKKVGSLPVPQALTLDTTPDGRLLWVGTAGEFLYAVDIPRLEVVERIPMPRSGPLSLTSVRALATTANGSLLLRAGVFGITSEGLVQYKPSTGEFIARPDGVGAQRFFRSRDGSKVLLAVDGTVALYDSATDSFVQNSAINGSRLAAIHPAGTQMAVRSGTDLVFLDGQLQEIARLANMTFAGVPIYSYDGRLVYIPENISILAGSSSFAVIDTQTFSIVGWIPDAFIPSECANFSDATNCGTTLRASDDTGFLIGPSPRGITFIDATQPRPLTGSQPSFNLNRPGTADPKQGRVSSGTLVSLNGGNFASGPTVFFGDTPGGVTATSSTALQVIAPSSSTPGAVNIAATFPNGWLALAPNAFSYGPTYRYSMPGGDAPAGGSRVIIFGLGLGFTASEITVSIGGLPARVLGSDLFPGRESMPSPIFYLAVDAPAGQPGSADVTITTPVGSTTIPRAFRYLKRVQNIPLSGSFVQVLYDGFRRRAYLLNAAASRIEVFSQDTGQFLTPVQTGVSPREMALTPSGSHLVVTNYGDKTISVIPLDDPSSAVSIPASDPTVVNDHRPLHVSATGVGTAFITYDFPTLSGLGLVRVLDLNSMTLRSPTTPCCLSTSILMGATGDGQRVYFAVQGSSGGEVFYWEAASDDFQQMRNLQQYIDEIAVSEDGQRWLVNWKILNSENAVESELSLVDLQAENGPPAVFAKRFHASGSLVYVPSVRGLYIFDAWTARIVRIYGGLSITDAARQSIALDESGQTLFAISLTGLQVVELDSVPLSIGSAQPPQVPTSGGTTVTIRGSGFSTGTTVRVGGLQVPASLVDSNTLRIVAPPMPQGRVRLTVINPDGERYDLDAALKYN